jgi:hypothetical protein
MDRADAVVLSFRLNGRFGDHGLTSTLVAFLVRDIGAGVEDLVTYVTDAA